MSHAPFIRSSHRAHTSPGEGCLRKGFRLKGAVPEDEGLAELVFVRLHPLMAWLAALFVVVVVGDSIVGSESPFATIFTVAGWFIWGILAAELALRFGVSPSKSLFLRRNWWQFAFLILPFLALFRFLLAIRLARAGRLLSAAVRGARSATSKLRNRLATVGAITVIVILISANIVFEFGSVQPYGRALHKAALATIAGEPMATETAVGMTLDVILSLYSVIVFAAVAGSLGAFFLEDRDPATTRDRASRD